MSNRGFMLNEKFRQVLSSALCFEMRDPELSGIIITRVKVSSDLQFADVRFSAEQRKAEKVKRALQRAKGALKHILAQQIKMKKVPELRFHLDQGREAELRIEKILGSLDIPKREDEHE